MKQKMVIKVSMHNQKSRKKALTIAVGCSGVISAALTGDDLRQIELTGDGVDVITLAKSLRKKVGHAEVVSVGPMADNDKTETAPAAMVALQPPHQCCTGHYIVYEHPFPDSGCAIL